MRKINSLDLYTSGQRCLVQLIWNGAKEDKGIGLIPVWANQLYGRPDVLAFSLTISQMWASGNQDDGIWTIICESWEWSKMESVKVPFFRDEQTKVQSQSILPNFKHNPLVSLIPCPVFIIHTLIVPKRKRNFYHQEILGKTLILLSLGCGFFPKHFALAPEPRHHTGYNFDLSSEVHWHSMR